MTLEIVFVGAPATAHIVVGVLGVNGISAEYIAPVSAYPAGPMRFATVRVVDSQIREAVEVLANPAKMPVAGSYSRFPVWVRTVGYLMLLERLFIG